ncbi:hemolymph proteinase 9 [Danaus plexippus plexippus]|uniref:Hemolymph proteinase 9 n=1 Tax=Danaus plexippus plexippus TaxID=278856 RepID=A0A212F357_DANPL|nr:hemolymph proteinase 9 [Danaus plexippus plexippus]
MLTVVLLVLSSFRGAYSETFQDTGEILEKFLLEAIKDNKTIDIDFGDSEEKPCIPLQPASESTPVPGRRISEQKCYEYVEQMKNREKEEKWAERYVKIKHIIVHPKYASPKKYYDIALIELEQEVKFIGNLQPACLWINNDFSELGNTASVTGWGYTENGHQSEVLRTATIPVIDTKQCEPLLVQHRNRNWNGLTNHQICAGNLTGGVDTCQV